ncbi:MAG: DUF929 family protein [Acidimicrobiia bacterium]
MSPKNRGSKYARAARRRNARTGGGANTTWWIVVAVIVAVGVALVIANTGGKDSSSTAKTAIKGRKPAPDSLVKKVTSVPSSKTDGVGLGTGKMPTVLEGAPQSAKPDVYFIGAEYCPFCAAERWSIVNALSRFGTFSDLKITSSSPTDVHPDTATFSFYQSKYTSPYLKFAMVEAEDQDQKQLETPTSAQFQVWQANGQSFPFMDFSGKYKLQRTFDPSVLAGKTHDQVAAALNDPNSDIAKGVLGDANAITATICKLTGNQPASACTPAIQELGKQLP